MSSLGAATRNGVSPRKTEYYLEASVFKLNFRGRK
jgi:hypothetical protein